MIVNVNIYYFTLLKQIKSLGFLTDSIKFLNLFMDIIDPNYE